MARMDCPHCRRAEDARAMIACKGCGERICPDCASENDGYCPDCVLPEE